MKKLFILFNLLFCISSINLCNASISANAYGADFSITEGEQTLWFKIMSDSTVQVVPYATYYSDNFPSLNSQTKDIHYHHGYLYSSIGTSHIIIPDSVNYNNRWYVITSVHGGILYRTSNEREYSSWSNAVNTYVDDHVYPDVFQQIESVVIPKSVEDIVGGELKHSLISIIYWNAENLTGVSCNVKNIVFGDDVKRFSINSGRVDSVFFYAKNCLSGSFGSAAYSIKSIIIGDSVQRIPSNVFASTSISSIIIPNSVSSIGSNAFRNCTSLQGTITVPQTVETIGEYAFYGCTAIDTLFIGAKTIEGFFAQNCNPNLIVNLDNSIKAIGDNAFNGFSGGNILSVPDSLKIIGNNAFKNCLVLPEKIHLHNTVERIESYAFAGCTTIDTIIIGAHYINGGYILQNCGQNIVVRLENSIQEIGNNAFRGFQSNYDLILPDSLLLIGDNAFQECSSITSSFYIPSSVQFIGDKAFYQCDNILQLDMNESPAFIPASCFEHCDRLVTVNLSPNTDSIQQNAFKNCKRLANVNIGDGTVSIGENAFQNCPRLINVHFGDGVQSIGNNAFKDDGRLLYSGLPAFLQTIGTNAFQNCTAFGGDVTIPAGVTEIKQFAFSGCNGITSLTMRPVNPPTIYATTFDSVDVNIPVYVPCGRVLHYYTTNYWENFPNLLEAEPYEVTVTSNDEMMGAVEVTQTPTCENPRARITATAIPGYHFVQWSDGNLANPRIVELSSDSTFEAQFAINYISILVHSSDSIKGNVTGSGRYYYDSPVSLTATPNNNYHFLCWSDGNTSNPRYMAATHDSTFTAVFVSNVSTITIGNNNPDMGNVSGGGVYYYQNWVTFSASPYYGYHFTQWSDGNVENPRTIMVDRDTTFTATFALNLYAVSVNSVNSTMGYVEGTGNYTYQTTIGITATPNYGYHFTQWNDGNTNNPRTIVVSKDTMFTAQFAANEYQLTVSSNYPAMGSAYGAGTFNYSTQTTIAAAANYGYHFTQWSDGNTENPRLVTVTHNTDFEAQFAPNLYAITTNASNPVCGSASGGGSYNYLSSISIVATPNYGYRFTQWSDGNTDNPRSITVMSNGTYTAQFAINSYAITALPNNSSRGLVSGSGNYVYNSATTISATAYYGYHFTQWNDGNTENPRTVVITQNAQYTAQFDYNTYQLNTFSNDITIGNVTGGGSYDFNSQVAITANAAPHHHFVHWNDTVADNPRTIVLTRDTNITAIFSIDRHSVDVRTANLQMGSTLGSGEYDYNASVFITAVPNYGYHFESWADGSTQNPRRIVVQNDSIFTAVFGINQYAIITHSNDTLMGSVTPSASYNYNTMATIMAMPAAGHHFVAWNDGNTDNPRTFVVTCDSTFTAQFAIKTYMLTVHPNDTAMGSVSGGGIYQYREQAVLSATAREHYHFVQWHDGNTSNPRILLVSNDSNFVAQFVEDERYEISVISTDVSAGTTTGSGSYYVGTQLYISANPDEHHLFTRWTDGSVDNPRSITVLGDATYIACFDPKDYEVSVFPNNETMGSVSGGGTFSYGTTTTINAYPRAGYHFERWSDGDVNASRTITVEGNTVYIAEFAEGVGIEENAANEEINVYPNPTKGSVTIHHGNVNGNILVYDVYGKLIKKQELESEQTEMNLSDCADGLYLLHIVSNGTLMKTMKVVKE